MDDENAPIAHCATCARLLDRISCLERERDERALSGTPCSILANLTNSTPSQRHDMVTSLKNSIIGGLKQLRTHAVGACPANAAAAPPRTRAEAIHRALMLFQSPVRIVFRASMPMLAAYFPICACSRVDAPDQAGSANAFCELAPSRNGANG